MSLPPEQPAHNQPGVALHSGNGGRVTWAVRLRWALIGAVITLLIGGVVWAARWIMANPLGSAPSTVDCSDFASFVNQPTMPAGMTHATCTYDSFLDEHLTADFDLADVSAMDEWLAGVTTSPELGTNYCSAGVSMCTSVDFKPRLSGGADALRVDVTSSSGSGVHVTMSAFNS